MFKRYLLCVSEVRTLLLAANRTGACVCPACLPALSGGVLWVWGGFDVLIYLGRLLKTPDLKVQKSRVPARPLGRCFAMQTSCFLFETIA